MTLPEISIRRHVLAWMISSVFVLLGIISFQKIGIDKFPTIDFPILTVTTTLQREPVLKLLTLVLQI